MKMAKASEADIDAAGKAMGLLDNLSRGYYPGVEDDAPLHFDPEDHAHLSLLYRLLTETLDASPGWPGRVIGGMCYVILYPANRIVDPDSDCLDLHPRFAQVEADRKELVEALAELCAVIDRSLQSLPNTGYRSDSPMGRARSLLARIQKESSK